ncbi:putative transposase (putative) [Pediococcus cellicola]|uniref:Putative transposase (Putative) n=1 Tax=Pediococcus cellicola TaxID=319652 RepID=A0A0R2IGA2_9LACO|nr:putative transposase (putative) [Pediococcus cellicola]
MEKLTILEEFKQANTSYAAFAKTFNIGAEALKHWQTRYERDGIEGLEEAHQNNHYSKELKLTAVLAYLAGKGTLEELTIKFGLRSHEQLRNWISRYNGDKTVTASPSRKQVPTMSRKTTTFEERIEVVEYVTKDNHSYSEAAEHFQVSYQQARMWVRKAEANGYPALMDNRGHRKQRDELTETEQLKLEIRQLKVQLKEKEIIEKFAKKLQELQHKG